MTALFGPAWILGTLLACWGLVLVLVLVCILRGVWWPPLDFRCDPVGSRLDGETPGQGRLTAFPPVVELFLGGNER